MDTFLGGATYGEGSGPIMGQLGCRGNEWFWQDCTYADWDTPYCGHAEDVAVFCSLAGIYYFDIFFKVSKLLTCVLWVNSISIVWLNSIL